MTRRRILTRLTVVAVLVFSGACQGLAPTAPAGSVQANVLPAPPPTRVPPGSGPSRVYVFDRPLLYPVMRYTEQSRFVFYDNGTFVLEYVSGLSYGGRFTEANDVITFEWSGWSAAGPWGATGTIKGNSMTVQYNAIMQLTDFEDAVYKLVEGQSGS